MVPDVAEVPLFIVPVIQDPAVSPPCLGQLAFAVIYKMVDIPIPVFPCQEPACSVEGILHPFRRCIVIPVRLLPDQSCAF